MVDLLRQISCRLVDIPENITKEEETLIEQEVSTELRRINDKASRIEQIRGYPVTITDIQALGHKRPEVVILDYISSGIFYNESCPLAIFYSL